jgi:anti-anti-sigma factor
MEYRIKTNDSSTELFLEDKLSSENCEKFSSLIDEFTKSPQKNLIINLENITILDTRGLGSLLLGLQKATDAAKKLILKNPKNDVKETLNMLNFNTLFEIEFAN